MNHTQTLALPFAGTFGDAAASVAARIAGIVRKISDAYRQERAVRDLERLTDRALYDIGLHRSQIRSAVLQGRS